MVPRIENTVNIRQFQPVAGTIQATLLDKTERGGGSLLQSPALVLNPDQKVVVPTQLKSQTKGSTKLISFLLGVFHCLWWLQESIPPRRLISL